MRVFLAGATGVIGRRLIPALLASGHQVTGMTRFAGRLEQLRAAGAEAVVADAFDEQAVTSAIGQARPDAVIDQLTSIPPRVNPRTMGRDFATNE